MTFLFTDNIISIFISKLRMVCPEMLIKFWDIFLIQGEKAVVQIIVKCFELYEQELLTLQEEDLLNFIKMGHIYVRAFKEHGGPGGLLVP